MTRPLRDLSDAVARAQREGFDGAATVRAGACRERPAGRRVRHSCAPVSTRCWRGCARSGTRCAGSTSFRRESVSNLSHDLRSPLTATAACLETLDRRWAGDAARADDRAHARGRAAQHPQRGAAGAFAGRPGAARRARVQAAPMTVDLRRGARRHRDALRRPRGAARAWQLRRARQRAAGAGGVRGGRHRAVRARGGQPGRQRAEAHARRRPRHAACATATIARVRISVGDTGSGIAAHDLPNTCSTASTPARGARRRRGGKGLGLAIVKRIAELHRGEVSVASEPGRGTEVTIRLPSASASVESRPRQLLAPLQWRVPKWTPRIRLCRSAGVAPSRGKRPLGRFGVVNASPPP